MLGMVSYFTYYVRLCFNDEPSLVTFTFSGFIDMSEIIQFMEFNYTQWKLFEEQGIKTLSDIKRKQMSITSNSLSQQMHEEML